MTTWIAIDSSAAIENLMVQFHSFHDACVREMAMVTGTFVHENRDMTAPGELDASLLLYFQSQSADISAIELKCERVRALAFVATPDGHDSVIGEGSLSTDDGAYRLALKFIAGPQKGPPDSLVWTEPASPDPDLVVVAEQMAWRVLTNAFGTTLRYRSANDGA